MKSGAARVAMTAALAAKTATRVKGLTATRQSRLRLVAVMVVVTVAATCAVTYRSARMRLDDRRAQLAATRDELATVRSTLADTRDEHARTETETVGAQSEITAQVDQRNLLDTGTQATLHDIAAVDQQLTEVNTSRFLVGAHARTVQACLDAVAQAIGASRDGNQGRATDVLRSATRDCGEALAYTSGADFAYDFADPFVLRASPGVYYAYSTNSGAGDIQVLRSSDLVHWELVGNALGSLPAWASPGYTWAPAVLARDGRYVAYYTARVAGSGRQCISRAVATNPAGPFVDNSPGPLVCDFGGSIDPSPFVDASGRAFLLWKADRFFETPPSLWSQELTADGLGLVGAPGQLVGVDRGFEHGVVEAPTMTRAGGRYVLLYAAADWAARSYSTAYAICAGPTGPCTKPGDGRILTSDARIAGPGGAEVFRDSRGALWVAFHAYAEPHVGHPSNRYLHIARLRISANSVSIDTST